MTNQPGTQQPAVPAFVTVVLALLLLAAIVSFAAYYFTDDRANTNNPKQIQEVVQDTTIRYNLLDSIPVTITWSKDINVSGGFFVRKGTGYKKDSSYFMDQPETAKYYVQGDAGYDTINAMWIIQMVRP